MRQLSKGALVTIISVILLAGCSSSEPTFNLEFEKYTLENGLDVVLHNDKSDPIVAVAILYHVGSNREKKGRTGFAHLFEHVMIQGSQHVGRLQFFKKIADAGGGASAGTGNDSTSYYEIVPKNALEMVLWMEADRMGFLLSSVTQKIFESQQAVVQNEKRSAVDNVPYGYTQYIVNKLLYPEGHPYNWGVMGEMADLHNATLKDVHDFHKKWYGPNNATLAIAGDFDSAQTKEWIEKYFGEIKSSDPVSNLDAQLVSLSETKRAYYQDRFAKSPELFMVFPTVQEFSKDAYALQYLAALLGGNRKTPLHQILVEEKKLAPFFSISQRNLEIAGSFRIGVRGFTNTNLTNVEESIKEALARFEQDGFTEKDLERLKTQQEVEFYDGISSVLDKAQALARYNEFAGSPGFINSDLQNYIDVTVDDIWRVYETYIKNRHYVLTSFVPQGRVDLIAAGSEEFPLTLESLEDQMVVARNRDVEVDISPIPSSFDRSQEPSKGPDPLLTIPEIWQDSLSNGIKILGIEHRELPLIQLSISIPGGDLGDDINKPAVSNLLSRLMMQGTKHKTPIELEEAIDELGASIDLSTNREEITLSAYMLATKYSDTLELVQEILLEPRWDEKEFNRLKSEMAEQINGIDANPSSTAGRVFNKLIFGKDHIFAYGLGTPEAVQAVTLDDLQGYYKRYFSPEITYITVVGDISRDEAVAGFENLARIWPRSDAALPVWKMPPAPEKPQLYFVDFPGVTLSQIRVGYPALKFNDPDFYAALVANQKLSRLALRSLYYVLREEKGYARFVTTGFIGGMTFGTFAAESAVKSTTTKESVQIFHDEMVKCSQGVSEEDISFIKNVLIKSNSRRFETLSALQRMLISFAKYELPFDYIKQQEGFLQNLTVNKDREIARKYINPDKMIYLVVGDKNTQLEPLSDLGLGEPILLDKYGNPIDK